MKHRILIVTTFALVLGLMTTGPALAADPPSEPLRVSNFGQKAPVTFDHARHGEVACAACHHNGDTGPYKCGECHGEEAREAAPKLKDAMHAKATGKCYGCHFGAEAQAKKLKCAECHVKR